MVDKHELHDDDEVLLEDDFEARDHTLEFGEEETLKEDRIKILRQKLKESEEERRKILDEKERTRADFLNGKRRLEEQFSRDKDRITDDVLRECIPLLDSFETALAHVSTGENESWTKGLQTMHAQFVGILKRYEVEEIPALHTTFNPHEHNAVSNVPVENSDDIDTVVTVFQKGYRRKGTVIRPATVAVGVANHTT